MRDITPIVSPSRQYVAICHKANFDGHYLRGFTLPEEWQQENMVETASWYFLNRLDGVACLCTMITREAYEGMEEVE